MKVFLSWSGDLSKQVALALRDWLPNVIQAIEPWMSSEDIEKGARWSSDIAKQLDTMKAGIVCITPENTDAVWLNFEAGALSKAVERVEMVCTYLFRLKPSDLKGPLVQFQASEATKEDTYKLLLTLNKAIPAPLTDGKLQNAFDVWWHLLETKLSSIAESPRSAWKPKRTTEDMLEEVVGIVREQAKAAGNFYAEMSAIQLHNAFQNTSARSFILPSESYGGLIDSVPIYSQGKLYRPSSDRFTEPVTIADFDPPDSSADAPDLGSFVGYKPPKEPK